MIFYLEDGREHLYQWDKDLRLIVTDQTITEVHFCNRTDECSLVVEVYEEEGKRVANIPNILLHDSWAINVYAYCVNHTKVSASFKVIKRSKPLDYVYTETEVKNWDELVQRMDQLEDEFESCGELEQRVDSLEGKVANYNGLQQRVQTLEVLQNGKADRNHVHILKDITDYKTPAYTIEDMPLTIIKETVENADNLLNANGYYEVRTSAVFDLGIVDTTRYARIEIAYGSDYRATFDNKFMAIVSNTSLPLTTTSANVLAYDMLESPNANIPNWTPDRAAIMDIPTTLPTGRLYLAIRLSHGINIHSIKLVEAPNLTQYALKKDIQGFATEDYVADAIAGVSTDMATKEEVSGKLDKVENANGIRVYAVNNSTQTTLSVGYGAGSNTVVRRNSSGRAEFSTPVSDEDAANKKYVDDAIAALRAELLNL